MDSRDYAEDINMDRQSSTGSPDGFAPTSAFDPAARIAQVLDAIRAIGNPNNIPLPFPHLPPHSEGDAVQAPHQGSQPSSRVSDVISPSSPVFARFPTAQGPDELNVPMSLGYTLPSPPYSPVLGEQDDVQAPPLGSQPSSRDPSRISPWSPFWANFRADHPYFPESSTEGDVQSPPPSSQPPAWDPDFYLVMAPASVKVGDEFKIILGSDLPQESGARDVAVLENLEKKLVIAISSVTAESKSGSFTFTGVFDPEDPYDGDADLEFSLYRDYHDGKSVCVGGVLVTIEVEQ